ncbi:unnamed protein product [Onchocerca flexuosa]|uniref:DHC_N2 domain-containing protein n=1 Tax=Onchocerca flexuosa TaxID=387005 RepID=A0A183I3G8_9BILA|nr:unnamed protein product [Onchocerca flexuosa]
MPILGAKEMWQKADRWSAFESEMFHLNDKTNQTFCLQPTHEEMITKLIAEQVLVTKLLYFSTICMIRKLMLFKTASHLCGSFDVND